MTDLSTLPDYDGIQPETLAATLSNKLSANLEAITQLVADESAPTWENTMAPLEAMGDALSRWFSPVGHLNHVKSNPALRQAYHDCLPLLSDYESTIGQHRGLFERIEALSQCAGFNHLEPAQQEAIRQELRDFKLAGVALPPDAQAEYKCLQRDLSALTSRFEDNVMDATDAWSYVVTDAAELAGVPEQTKQIAKANANGQGWRLGLDFPCYYAIMTYADNRALRQRCHEAYVTRASDVGPHDKALDNSAVMREILEKRYAMAQLLGYPHYAAQSIVPKMVEDVDMVMDFLAQLVSKTKTRAEAEFSSLSKFAQAQGATLPLAPWDIAYYSEKQKQHLYDIDDEALRPYFPLPQVMDGLNAVLKRLFGVSLIVVKDVSTWHEDVVFYAIHDKDDALLGYLYTDLFARKNKRGGAWMDECVGRFRHEGRLQKPVAYLTCNFQPPVTGKPSLLTHDDVVTLFHECGHCLQHLLTRIDYASVAGISGVPWDAVELPSQFLENWCWTSEGLRLLSKHYETGEVLSDEHIQRLKSAQNFQSAIALMRQLEFALFDFKLHMQSPDNDNIVMSMLEEIRSTLSVTPVIPENRFAHSFGHIFAGGYAAGYYSYLWAEVLSSDAFSRFEEEGLFDEKAGQDFRTYVLEPGGSCSPMTAFEAFRGRGPSLEALLRHRGIAQGT